MPKKLRRLEKGKPLPFRKSSKCKMNGEKGKVRDTFAELPLVLTMEERVGAGRDSREGKTTKAWADIAFEKRGDLGA